MATANEEETYLLGSEDLHTMKCHPCQKKGRLEKAVEMCIDCQDYLCQRCYDVHTCTVPVPLETHELLDKEMLRSQVSLKQKDECTERCAVHEDEAIKYYCINHCQLGCSVCITVAHMSCDQVRYIPHVAKDVFNNKEYNKTEACLKTMIAKADLVKESVKQKTQSLQDNCLNAITKVRDFRQEINKVLDNLETDLVENVELFKLSGVKKMESIASKCKMACLELQTSSEQVENLENIGQNCQLYTVMMKTKNRLKSLQDEIEAIEVEQALINSTVTFVPDRDILNTLRNTTALGIVSKSNAGVHVRERANRALKQVEHVKDINVKSAGDKSDCWITGSVSLADNRLLLADFNNKAIKMVDIRGGIIISNLILSSSPWDVTLVNNDNNVAVTLPNEKKIAVVTVNDSSMSLDRTFSVRWWCCGVAYNDGKLAVAYYNQNEVQVLDLQGSVLHNVGTDNTDQSIVRKPLYVKFGRNNTTLYVSTDDENKLVCVKFDGTVVATYTDTKLKGPGGVAIDSDGNVYICSRDTNQILQITPYDNTMKQVEGEGLSWPYSLSYNETNHTIFVGTWVHANHCNIFRMYKAIFNSD